MQKRTGERIILVARSSWIPYIPGIVAGFLMIISPWFFPFPPAPLFGTALGLALVAWYWVKHRCYAVTVTNQRIIFRRGVFHPNRDELEATLLHSVHVERSFLDRACGSGTVVLQSARSRRDAITVVGRPQALCEAVEGVLVH